jgi:hypothetical protein
MQVMRGRPSVEVLVPQSAARNASDASSCVSTQTNEDAQRWHANTVQFDVDRVMLCHSSEVGGYMNNGEAVLAAGLQDHQPITSLSASAPNLALS